MEIGKAGSGPAHRPRPSARSREERARNDEASSARTVVSVSPVRSTGHSSANPSYMPRNESAFIAHLIATAQDAPQTRLRRRRDPQEAADLYAGAMREPAARAVPLSRSL